jgi:hypothetical protein
MKTYNFVYKTSFNDGRYYIGQHKTDKLDDHYFGSSEIVRDLIKNHPELEPKREILRYCDTQDELNYWEKYFIGDNWKNDSLCLNNSSSCNISENGTMFGRTGEKNPMFGRTGEKNPMFGRTGEKCTMYGVSPKDRMSPEVYEQWCSHLKGENNPMYGVSPKDRMSPEVYEQWREKSKGENNPMYGKPSPNRGRHRVYRDDGSYYYA